MTNRRRFITDPDRPTLHCMGSGHRDSGVRGSCRGCGKTVVRLEGGRVLDILTHITERGMVIERYACWTKESHTCHEGTAKAYQEQYDLWLSRGHVIVDQRVKVVRGRKVPKGTVGTIVWRQDTEHGVRVGLQTDAGEVHYTALKNLDVVPLDTVQEVAEKAPETSAAPARGSHAACTHEKTPAARRQCRKARPTKE